MERTRRKNSKETHIRTHVFSADLQEQGVPSNCDADYISF